MKKQQRRYHSYLLRLWQTSNGKKQIWRASLESPGSGERQGFASLKDLYGFLCTQTGLENCAHDIQSRIGGDAATISKDTEQET